MQPIPVFQGLGMLGAALGMTVFVWDVVFDPRLGEKAREHLREGMTPAEVEAVMGGEGTPWLIGRDVPNREDHYARIWADPRARVVVTYRGPKERATVCRIHEEPIPAEAPFIVWAMRIPIVLMALGGLSRIAYGLCSWPKPSTTDASPHAPAA